MPLECPAYSRRVQPHPAQIRFAPAIGRPTFKFGYQCLDDWIGTRLRGRRLAPLTGPETGIYAFCNGLMKCAVFPLGFAGRTGQPAEDPCRGNANKRPPVIGRIPVQERLVKRIEIRTSLQHSGTIGRSLEQCSRKSGVYLLEFNIQTNRTFRTSAFKFPTSACIAF